MRPNSGLYDDLPFPVAWVEHAQVLLDSYCHWLGRELCERVGTPKAQAIDLFEASLVVVSHGTEPDPILNYGNLAALDLWEMDIPTLIATPSRLSAEPMHRDERDRLLATTCAQGYVGNYAGIRISRSGRRFRIRQAIVWNLIDADGHPCGQAASFSDWEPLGDD